MKSAIFLLGRVTPELRRAFLPPAQLNNVALQGTSVEIRRALEVWGLGFFFGGVLRIGCRASGLGFGVFGIYTCSSRSHGTCRVKGFSVWG